VLAKRLPRHGHFFAKEVPMTRADEFPYRECSWHQDDQTSQRWLSALEKTGVENVRARLAQSNYASVASIAIGTEMTQAV
jgi:hypothetical protein